MSITFHIAATTIEEYEQLESEGAPSLNMANGNAFAFMRGVLGWPDPDYSGSFDPDEFLTTDEDLLEIARSLDAENPNHNGSDYYERKTQAFNEVVLAASRIGRNVFYS